MMTFSNIDTGLYDRVTRILFQYRAQCIGADNGVLFHDLPFVRGQLVRFHQDAVRDTHLANVM